MKAVFLLHPSPLHQLKLMEFHRSERQCVYQPDVLQYGLAGLRRQTQDEMSTGLYPALRRHGHGTLRTLEIMAPVHPPEGLVAA